MTTTDRGKYRGQVGVGARFEEIECVSLVRSVSWELDGETIDTTESNMYTHDYS